LGKLREETKIAIPLAWSPAEVAETSAIEVYPGATLKMAGMNKDWSSNEPKKHYPIEGEVKERDLSKDERDAIVCVLAALDFMTGKCQSPEDKALALREGWIWLRTSPRNPPPNLCGGFRFTSPTLRR
jgi:hypothetical protein